MKIDYNNQTVVFGDEDKEHLAKYTATINRIVELIVLKTRLTNEKCDVSNKLNLGQVNFWMVYPKIDEGETQSHLNFDVMPRFWDMEKLDVNITSMYDYYEMVQLQKNSL